MLNSHQEQQSLQVTSCVEKWPGNLTNTIYEYNSSIQEYDIDSLFLSNDCLLKIMTIFIPEKKRKR